MLDSRLLFWFSCSCPYRRRPQRLSVKEGAGSHIPGAFRLFGLCWVHLQVAQRKPVRDSATVSCRRRHLTHQTPEGLLSWCVSASSAGISAASLASTTGRSPTRISARSSASTSFCFAVLRVMMLSFLLWLAQKHPTPFLPAVRARFPLRLPAPLALCRWRPDVPTPFPRSRRQSFLVDVQ